MRIIIIHRSFALTGGAERVIIEKANYLSEQGHTVMLVSYEQGAHPISFPLLDAVKVVDLDCRFFTLSTYSPLAHYFHFLRLKKKFRESLLQTVTTFRPEVIVLASDWQFLIRPVLKAARTIPVMCEFHVSYDFVVKNISGHSGGIKAQLARAYARHAVKGLRGCVQLISLTQKDAQRWKDYARRVVVIPNPLFLYPETTDDVPRQPARIICVGRLSAEKRFDRTITAFSLIADKHPDWHIDIFGEGVEKASLQQRIVIHSPTKAIFDEYKKSQLLVLSSEFEGLPMVLLEAMSCGTPCLSFNCPSGPAEIIDHNVNGLLAKNGDVDDLAEKMEWLITHDEERKAMGRKARIAAERYKPSLVQKEWERAYTDNVQR